MTSDRHAGRNVDLGDRLVHLVERAGRRPTVLLIGGCGVPYYHWDAVVRRLGDQASIRLDRPGLTDTPWPGVLPTLAAEIATLDDLLAQLSGPVIMVAHSMAGPHAEALLRVHPGRADQVAGLVLVDASVDFAAGPQRSGPAWLLASHLVHAAAAVPPMRLVGSLADRLLLSLQSGRRIRDPAQPEARAIYRDRDALASVVAEQAAYRQQLWDLERIRRQCPWPDVSTVVLTAAGAGGRRWIRTQRRLAELLGAEHVVLPAARHMIMIDEPDAVVAAIRSGAIPSPDRD